VVNTIVGEFVNLQRGRFFDAQLLRRCRPATRVVLVFLMASVSSAAGCGTTNAAPTVPDPEVQVAHALFANEIEPMEELYGMDMTEDLAAKSHRTVKEVNV